MIKYLISFTLILFCNGCAPTRIPQMSAADRANEAPQPVSSIYHIVADIIPESLLVRARVEIDFQNLTADTLHRLTLIQPINVRDKHHTGERGSHIDSMCLNGAPVPVAEVADSALIPFSLPSPLKQGERVAVSFSVTARISADSRWWLGRSECVRFVNWLPHITGWGKASGNRPKREAEPADYGIEMTIDSGLLVVASGELLNDKELLGMVPSADSVFVDVIHNPYSADGYVFSRLPARNGKDTYVWRARFIRGFDFLVLGDYLLDRGRKGDLVVESYYPRERALVHQDRVVADGLQSYSQTSAVTGFAPNRPLRLVVAGTRTIWFSSNVQLLSAKGKRPKFLPLQGTP